GGDFLTMDGESAWVSPSCGLRSKIENLCEPLTPFALSLSKCRLDTRRLRRAQPERRLMAIS
ncbi:MAG: hypothetical protein ABI605_15505, partial [Rhizobacter sp.]